MAYYGNNLDVSNRIDTTDHSAVNAEVDQIFSARYPGASTQLIDQAFHDLHLLYSGQFPGFHPCDTAYHDIQHVLDVTLAMARLMDGYQKARGEEEPFLNERLYTLGVITALYHDCGYVRELDDTQHANGGELTLVHVSRGAHFLQKYLPTVGMPDVADVAATLVHFTGYEQPVAKIEVPAPVFGKLGRLLGSADIIAQMADRCYLEKCRDRLYPEFVAAGIARKQLPDGKEDVIFESGEDLVRKTPKFYQGAMQRLSVDLDGCFKYAADHFGGANLYLDEINKNILFAEVISKEYDTALLKRTLPHSLGSEEESGSDTK